VFKKSTPRSVAIISIKDYNVMIMSIVVSIKMIGINID